MVRIYISDELNDDTVVEVLQQMAAAKETPEVQFDFSRLGWALPYATLVLAAEIDAFRNARRELGLRTRYEINGVEQGTRSRGAGYLAHVGFFKTLGIPHGNEPGEAAGSQTYVPITRLRREDLQAVDPSGQIGDSISRESYRLAQLASREEEAQELLAYVFRETIRNVFEHAGVSQCLLMAQKWTGSRVEIAVADQGRGVHASLSEAFPGISPDLALRKAILPGISRSTTNEGRGKWENTGFGLYVLSELGRTHGHFCLWSSGCALQVDAGAFSVNAQPISGTAVKVNISLVDAESFPNLLAAIVARGESSLPEGAVDKTGPSKLAGGWA